MKKWKSIVRRLLHPPKWVLFAVTPLVFAALIFLFAVGHDETDAVACTVYALSAYCLTVTVTALIEGAAAARKALLSRAAELPAADRYLHDPAFRAGVGLFCGMLINFAYTLFRIAAGILHTSVWFVSMAVYYLVLGLLRADLAVGYRRRAARGIVYEYRLYRRTALLLFLLNIPMGGMILQMILVNAGYSYPGYIIYVSALYSFYALITSAVNLAKYRRLGSPILSAAKALNFISALMSLLGLQSAMIAQFSQNDDGFRRLMNTCTGVGVFCAVILTAALMLRRAAKYKKEAAALEPTPEDQSRK